MTDSEIIAALTTCHKGNGESECEKCPYVVIRGCMDILGEDALGLINRQQIEIEKLKAADVQPVKHGKWIYNPNGMDFNLGAWECSVCTQKNNNLPCSRNISPYICVGSKYCPSCGAKMDGKEVQE